MVVVRDLLAAMCSSFFFVRSVFFAVRDALVVVRDLIAAKCSSFFFVRSVFFAVRDVLVVVRDLFAAMCSSLFIVKDLFVAMCVAFNWAIVRSLAGHVTQLGQQCCLYCEIHMSLAAI